jgi:flavin-dependent dehydrogenase
MIDVPPVDVLVIGGGPAGATVSTLIAQKGYKVQLFEREKFPRFHIGESLIPETYWVLERLNMLPKMRNSPFVKKYSVQFVGQSGRLSEPFYFDEHKPHEASQTWQVLRSEFDLMMLDNAREHGVEVFEETRVIEVLFEGEQAVGLRVAGPDGAAREVRARVVIDASGQSAVISNRFKLRVNDPELKKGAVWTYFEGAYRDSGKDEGATIVLSTEGRRGWFWYIPLHRNIVSVGVVSEFTELFQPGMSHEQIYAEQLEKCPAVKQRVSQGKRVAEYYATKDYSYRAKQVAGDGWVLIGDAYGFLDPLYSSGVLLALKSGQLAADAICEALTKNDTTAAALGKWSTDFCRGMDRMRRLVCEFYNGFSFGRFVKEYPRLKGHLTDLLIGDLFDGHVDEVIEPMESTKRDGAYVYASMPE